MTGSPSSYTPSSTSLILHPFPSGTHRFSLCLCVCLVENLIFKKAHDVPSGNCRCARSPGSSYSCPLKLRRWWPSVQHGAQVSLRKPQICGCSQQETQHKGITSLSGHRSDIFSRRADFHSLRSVRRFGLDEAESLPRAVATLRSRRTNHHPGSCCPSAGRTWAKKSSARANPTDFRATPTVPSAKEALVRTVAEKG